jgi:two-component system chemotaxis response regulator CheB
MGASAGGLETFHKILLHLPPDLKASLFLVLHTGSDTPNRLAVLLGRNTAIPVTTALDGEAFQPGTAYVAPPDFHLTFRDEHLAVHRGPKENRYRPSIDTTFRSAARNFGPRVIGVLLTGLLDDGALGLQLVGQSGGITIVQDPDDALFNSMPLAALDLHQPDRVLPAREIPAVLVEFSMKNQNGSNERSVPVETRQEIPDKKANTPEGKQSEFTCPECHGRPLGERKRSRNF